MVEELLTTKLHRPDAPEGWIERPVPFARLEEGSQAPLTLVSAPAGYGKSVTVAAWLASREEPSAWLSLDAGESETPDFLSYLLAAVRTLFPGVCSETEQLLQAVDAPPASVLARPLANELDRIEQPFVLVLDDYHRLEGRAVHDLLAALLEHPPLGLHLVIITRRDPPLPLASLRARGQLVELRAQELQFDRSESDRFIAVSTSRRLGQRSLAHLHEVMEGWPVGLRLVSLALRRQEDPDAFLLALEGVTPEVQDYLIQAVLAGLSDEERAWAVRSAILDRFHASLCDAVCGAEGDAPEASLDGKGFLDTARASGLFLIPLDESREWYRYHHTFQQLLLERLERTSGPTEIRDLHARAARWFAAENLPGDALRHALEAGDPEFARELVRANRTLLVNTEQWGRLDRWIARLPEPIVAADPALLVAKAWSCEYACRSCAADHLEQAEEQLAGLPQDAPEREEIEGELAALRTLHHYNLGRPEAARAFAKRALASLAPAAHSFRDYVRIVDALASQSLGDFEPALHSLHAAIEGYPRASARRSLLLTGLSYLYWQEGDLVRMRQSALEDLRLGEQHGLRTSIAYAAYLLGVLHYMRDERAEAAHALQRMMELRYFASQAEHAHAAFCLVLLRLGEGHADDAAEVLRSISQHLFESGHARLLDLVRAFEAEFDLRTGRTERAVQWARTCSPEPVRDLYMFYVPQLTLSKAWLADASSESREKAAELLDRLLGLSHTAHLVPVRIQALAQRALVHEAEGETEAAAARLSEALELAAPGGFVRPFVDLGAPMAALLERLPESARSTELASRIRAGSGSATQSREARATAPGLLSDGAGRLAEPLTNREQDVLELLAERLRDKEIADKLVVSPATVKSHLKGLYRKLGVSGRREAVARARDVGILSTP